MKWSLQYLKLKTISSAFCRWLIAAFGSCANCFTIGQQRAQEPKDAAAIAAEAPGLARVAVGHRHAAH